MSFKEFMAKNRASAKNRSGETSNVEVLVSAGGNSGCQRECALGLKQKADEALNAGSIEEAIRQFTSALEKAADHDDLKSSLFINRALAFQRAGQHERAAVDAKRAIRVDSTNQIAHVRLGDALIAQQRLQDAVAAYTQATIQCPTCTDLRQKLEEAQEMCDTRSRLDGGLRSYGHDYADPIEAWDVMKHDQQHAKSIDTSTSVAASDANSDGTIAKDSSSEGTSRFSDDTQFSCDACPGNLSGPLGEEAEGARDFVRFVCISDTHGTHRDMKLPLGDVLLHSGDFSQTGEQQEIEDFAAWIAEQPHTHKVVIAGNHEVTMDSLHYERCWRRFHKKKHDSALCRAAIQNAPGVTYLEDSATEIAGVKLFGSPWQPKFFDWGFNVTRGSECRAKWDLIPDTTHILMTHGPPVGYGDAGHSVKHAGCVDLLQCVQQRVRPLFHVFGHLHYSYGSTTDGDTTFINASSCDEAYFPSQHPIVFDVRRCDLATFEARFIAPAADTCTGGSGASAFAFAEGRSPADMV
jgi:tetratricopeptide (TPR) repeat protein